LLRGKNARKGGRGRGGNFHDAEEIAGEKHNQRGGSHQAEMVFGRDFSHLINRRGPIAKSRHKLKKEE